jgi:hypothetical protein
MTRLDEKTKKQIEEYEQNVKYLQDVVITEI